MGWISASVVITPRFNLFHSRTELDFPVLVVSVGKRWIPPTRPEFAAPAFRPSALECLQTYEGRLSLVSG